VGWGGGGAARARTTDLATPLHRPTAGRPRDRRCLPTDVQRRGSIATSELARRAAGRGWLPSPPQGACCRPRSRVGRAAQTRADTAHPPPTAAAVPVCCRRRWWISGMGARARHQRPPPRARAAASGGRYRCRHRVSNPPARRASVGTVRRGGGGGSRIKGRCVGRRGGGTRESPHLCAAARTL